MATNQNGIYGRVGPCRNTTATLNTSGDTTFSELYGRIRQSTRRSKKSVRIQTPRDSPYKVLKLDLDDFSF